MRTTLYAIAAAALIVLLLYLGKLEKKPEPSTPDVKILFQCGTMAGDADMFVSVDGETEHHSVHCGGPSV